MAEPSLLVLPATPPSAAPAPPGTAENSAPPQAYAVNEHKTSKKLTRSQWLKRLRFTAKSPKE